MQFLAGLPDHASGLGHPGGGRAPWEPAPPFLAEEAIGRAKVSRMSAAA